MVAVPTVTTEMIPAVANPTIPATLGLSVSYVMVPPLLAFVATTLKYESPYVLLITSLVGDDLTSGSICR